MRKTAAICISKLYATDPALMEKMGFMELLESLINDKNAMVVANAITTKLII